MKKFIFSPLFLIFAGLIGGWALTRLSISKDWKFISGGAVYAYSLSTDCNACFVPDSAEIPGAEAISSSAGSSEAEKFKELSDLLTTTAVDASGAHLWNITNRGGYIHKDVLKTLLGSLSTEEDKVGYYFGLSNDGSTPNSFLSLVFIKGTKNCSTEGLTPEQAEFLANPVIHTVGGMDETAGDTTPVSCPPHCPSMVCPDGCPTFPSTSPSPESIAPGSLKAPD